jgi:hypothetical protein
MDQENDKLIMESRGSHLFVRACGLRTRSTVTAMARKILEAAVARGHSTVLVDVRELKGQLGVFDSYVIGSELFESLRGKGIIKAAILDEPLPSGGKRFLETVAQNRGFSFEIFMTEEDALVWLDF